MVRTETYRNSICFGCFLVCFAKPKNIFFGLFRCFGQVLKQPKQTELCQNKPEQTKTNRKNYQQMFPIRGSSKQLVFFSVWTETNRNSICFGCFLVCFLETKKFVFGLFWYFGPVSKQPKQTELMVWGIKKVDILTNLLLFRLIFFLFLLFRNTETPCFNIKAKQPKQKSCFG